MGIPTGLCGCVRQPSGRGGGLERPQHHDSRGDGTAPVRAGHHCRRSRAAFLICTAAHSKFLRDICGDQATLLALADDPSGGTLGPVDSAVYRFAAKVATDAAAIQQADIDRLRDLGLSDADIADVVYAAAARSFFTRVLDGLGARLDAATAEAFPPQLRASMLVGRPALDGN